MNDETIDRLATELLHDIDVALGYDYAEKERRMFSYLQPYYDNIGAGNDTPVYENVIMAYEALEEVKKPLFRSVLIVALRKCLYRLASFRRQSIVIMKICLKVSPDDIPLGTWKRFLKMPDSNPKWARGFFLGDYAAILRRESISLLASENDWVALVKDIEIQALPVTAPWAMLQVRGHSSLVPALYKISLERLTAGEKRLGQFGIKLPLALKNLDDTLAQCV